MISLVASENMAADLTIADVYEDASLIGQDIEKVIERFGHDAVVDFMPKVICVLEKLELVVGEREKDKLEIAELKLENERLYLDIKREASQRRKLDEELYLISCSGESDNLKSMLVKLQEENRKLRLEYEVTARNQPVTAYISAPGDAELMHKMKETIDNQRDTIRSKNQEIKSQRNDMEAIEEQIERLTNINQNVRRSLAASQERITLLAKEKAELQTELRALRRTSQQEPENDDENSENENSTDSDLELEQYGKTLTEEIEKEATQKYEDKYTEFEESPSVDQNPPPKPPRLHLAANQEKEEDNESVNNNKKVLVDEEKTAERNQENGSDVTSQEEGDWEIVESQKPSIKAEEKPVERTGKGKEERDKKDPNRPRYTKAELLEILIERNKLKERVWALQEELAIYKPSDLLGEETNNLRRNSMSPRRETRKEESGISRIFHIFARKGES